MNILVTTAADCTHTHTNTYYIIITILYSAKSYGRHGSKGRNGNRVYERFWLFARDDCNLFAKNRDSWIYTHTHIHIHTLCASVREHSYIIVRTYCGIVFKTLATITRMKIESVLRSAVSRRYPRGCFGIGLMRLARAIYSTVNIYGMTERELLTCISVYSDFIVTL